MKKKMFLPYVVSLALIILFVSPAHALFNTDVKKAKEFMSAGMYPQAIELLNKRINDKPTDAEAHFQLGVCYINTGNYSRADQRFGSAVKLKPDYGYQIGGKYKKVGDEALNKGNTGRAQSLYQKAVQYQPDLKSGIVKETFSQGKGFFDKGQYDLADNVFSVEIAFDASFSQEICDMYFNLGKSADAEQGIDLFHRAKNYSSSHNQEIGQKMVELAKADGVSNADKKRYKEEVGRYLDKAEMKKAFPPDYITYNKGQEKIFELKKGEFSDHYVKHNRGTNINWLIDYGEYEVHTRSGKIYKMGKVPEYFLEDFKISAETDVRMGLRFE